MVIITAAILAFAVKTDPLIETIYGILTYICFFTERCLRITELAARTARKCTAVRALTAIANLASKTVLVLSTANDTIAISTDQVIVAIDIF